MIRTNQLISFITFIPCSVSAMIAMAYSNIAQ